MEDGYILLLFQSTRKNGRDPIIGRKERGIQSDFFKQFQDERWRQSLTNEKRDERMESFFPPPSPSPFVREPFFGSMCSISIGIEDIPRIIEPSKTAVRLHKGGTRRNNTEKEAER